MKSRQSKRKALSDWRQCKNSQSLKRKYFQVINTCTVFAVLTLTMTLQNISCRICFVLQNTKHFRYQCSKWNFSGPSILKDNYVNTSSCHLERQSDAMSDANCSPHFSRLLTTSKIVTKCQHYCLPLWWSFVWDHLAYTCLSVPSYFSMHQKPSLSSEIQNALPLFHVLCEPHCSQHDACDYSIMKETEWSSSWNSTYRKLKSDTKIQSTYL